MPSSRLLSPRASLIWIACLILPLGMTRAEMEGFGLEIGRWQPELEALVRVDDALVTGDTFDLVNLFGVDDDEYLTSVRLRLSWGRKNAHHLNFSHAATDYLGTASLTADLQIGDTLYLIGETVSLGMDLTLAQIDYGFSFVNKEHVDFGFRVGVVAVETDGGFASTLTGVEDFDATAPLPIIGMYLDMETSPRHRLRFSVSGMSLDVGDVDGDVTQWEAQYQFFPWKGLGFGLGIRSFELDVEVEDEGFLNLTDEGPFWSVVLRI